MLLPPWIYKIIELMICLLRDTTAKTCMGSDGRVRLWWRLVAILKK
jgi:hypothetical protein